VAGVLVGVFIAATAPNAIDIEQLPEHTANVQNGERMFWAGGCASCHAKGDAKGDEKLLLSG